MANVTYNYLISCDSVDDYHEKINEFNLELYNRLGIDKFLMSTDSDNQNIITRLGSNNPCNVTLCYICDDSIYTAQIKAYINNVTNKK